MSISNSNFNCCGGLPIYSGIRYENSTVIIKFLSTVIENVHKVSPTIFISSDFFLFRHGLFSINGTDLCLYLYLHLIKFSKRNHHGIKNIKQQ